MRLRWRGVIARSIDQLRFEDGLPSLAEDQVGFGFFDTVALQGQDTDLPIPGRFRPGIGPRIKRAQRGDLNCGIIRTN